MIKYIYKYALKENGKWGTPATYHTLEEKTEDEAKIALEKQFPGR